MAYGSVPLLPMVMMMVINNDEELDALCAVACEQEALKVPVVF